ncbi:SRPBCC family protein [Streptomyces sp. NPDC005963]|uniref:SRPBCC family protein n=1 Tax=Streptomyces sp. NPDC005963 TaxID=3156721 RepID=UPI0033F55956
MGVYNVHERLLTAEKDAVGALVDALAGDGDPLWPHGSWPRMEFDGPLTTGAVGGHGPIRYTVIAHVPAVWVRFAFSGPRGFDGFHEFTVLPVDDEHALLRHTLAMETHGTARLTWPALWRPLHDALLEDSLDRAELACTGSVARPARWSAYVRLVRRLAR